MTRNGERRWTTIFVDASMCHETGAGGWAAWVKSGRGNGEILGGAFREVVASSGEAELKAAANAVALARKAGLVAPGSGICLQSDSEEALAIVWKVSLEAAAFVTVAPSCLTARRVRISNYNLAACDALRRALDGVFAVSLKHVKGHSSGKDGRSWANKECDRVARAFMREARADRRCA